MEYKYRKYERKESKFDFELLYYSINDYYNN